jgi:hypothetical protein
MILSLTAPFGTSISLDFRKQLGEPVELQAFHFVRPPIEFRLLRGGYANRVVLQREEFSLAIRRVAQFSDERSNAVRIRLGKDELKVSSSSVEIGESEDTIQTTYSGDPTLIGFNSQYLLDFLKVVGSAGVRFEFKRADRRRVEARGSRFARLHLPICGDADLGLMEPGSKSSK